MRSKLRLILLLGSLVTIPPFFISASNPAVNECIDNALTYRHKHKVHTNLKYKDSKQRSVLSSCGNVEENTLYLYFSSPLENVSLEIINVETGEVVFSERFSGSSLAIPLENDGYEFNITVN